MPSWDSHVKMGIAITACSRTDKELRSTSNAVEGWLIPGRNPFGLYLYTERVDELAKLFNATPENKPWGMYEFSISDPDETLVRIGYPSEPKNQE